MASMRKYKRSAVQYVINHNIRNYGRFKPSNEEIDFNRTKDNYFLTPESHGRTAQEIKEYYNNTLRQYYQYGSKRLVTLVEWIITAPPELTEEQEYEFFLKSYEFLCSLYGEQNCILSVTHKDEKVFDHAGVKRFGQNHMHTCIIPTVKNTDKNSRHKASQYDYRVCADKLFKKKDLLAFHPAFQKYLDQHLSFKVCVHKSEIGKSYLNDYKTVEHLKDKTKIELERERVRELERELEKSREVIKEMSKEMEQKRSHDMEHTWGNLTSENGSWGSSFTR